MRNPEREWSGGKALIEDQRMYPQAEILKIYTTKIFDIHFKITCCVPKKILKNRSVSGNNLTEISECPGKIENFACFTVRNK